MDFWQHFIFGRPTIRLAELNFGIKEHWAGHPPLTSVEDDSFQTEEPFSTFSLLVLEEKLPNKK